VQAVRQCETQSKTNGDAIRAVSVVVPGSVNVEQGLVVKAPNVACLDGFRLTAALTSELKLPAILETMRTPRQWARCGRERATAAVPSSV